MLTPNNNRRYHNTINNNLPLSSVPYKDLLRIEITWSLLQIVLFCPIDVDGLLITLTLERFHSYMQLVLSLTGIGVLAILPRQHPFVIASLTIPTAALLQPYVAVIEQDYHAYD
jgi:hypothetical protein